jgi:hypothetical protein
MANDPLAKDTTPATALRTITPNSTTSAGLNTRRLRSRRAFNYSAAAGRVQDAGQQQLADSRGIYQEQGVRRRYRGDDHVWNSQPGIGAMVAGGAGCERARRVGVKLAAVSTLTGIRFRYRCAGGSMSVGDGFVIAMTSAPIDTTSAINGDVVPRRRGKSKAPNFTYEGPVSVIRLRLDVSDPVARWRMERQWVAVFRLRRALQRDAATRCRAYWA